MLANYADPHHRILLGALVMAPYKNHFHKWPTTVKDTFLMPRASTVHIDLNITNHKYLQTSLSSDCHFAAQHFYFSLNVTEHNVKMYVYKVQLH